MWTWMEKLEAHHVHAQAIVVAFLLLLVATALDWVLQLAFSRTIRRAQEGQHGKNDPDRDAGRDDRHPDGGPRFPQRPRFAHGRVAAHDTARDVLDDHHGGEQRNQRAEEDEDLQGIELVGHIRRQIARDRLNGAQIARDIATDLDP